MRVLLVTHDFPPAPTGGEGVVAGTLARLLVSVGVDLEVVAPNQDGAVPFDESAPYVVHRVDSPAKTFLRRTPSFYRASAPVIRRYQGDLVYYFRPAILRGDLPSVVHFHTTRFGEAMGCFRSRAYLSGILNLLYVPIERRMVRAASLVVVPTETMKSEVVKFSAIQYDAISVLHNPVAVDYWSTSVVDHRQGYGIKLLYVGRLDLRKGIFDLLQAFKCSLSQVAKISLHIVGNGPMRRKLQRWVRSNGCTELVTFQDGVPMAEVRQLYQSHDIVVVPSLYEPFGVVVAEALASGAAVISSDACVDLGQVRFPRGNIDALCSVIVDSARSIDVRSRSKENNVPVPVPVPVPVLEPLEELREEVVVKKLQDLFALARARFGHG